MTWRSHYAEFSRWQLGDREHKTADTKPAKRSTRPACGIAPAVMRPRRARRGRGMGAAWPIRDDVPTRERRRLARLEDDGRIACRRIALANALEGMSRARAAEQAGMDRQTLRDWVIRFNQAGVEGWSDRARNGRPSFLTDGRLATLQRLGVARPRLRARRPQQLDGQRSVAPRRGPLRRELPRERHAQPAPRPRAARRRAHRQELPSAGSMC